MCGEARLAKLIKRAKTATAATSREITVIAGGVRGSVWSPGTAGGMVGS